MLRAFVAAACCIAVGSLGLTGLAAAEPHTFELNAPDARHVYLAGEMTAWDKGKLPMLRNSDAKWRVTVDLGPGQWLYKFVVDGRWMADPASPDHDADGQGGEHPLSATHSSQGWPT